MAPRVRSLMFYPSGTFNDQYNRGYTSGLRDRDVIDEFMNATDDGNRINAANISSIATDIITLTSDVDRRSPIYIPGGWGEQRRAFVMVVETDHFGDERKYQIITGFTDRVDVSHGGHVAPDLELFINNITEYREIDSGRRRDHFISDNSFILRGSQGHLDRRSNNGRRTDAEDDIRYLRPSDVFYHLSAPAQANRYGGRLAGVSDNRNKTSYEFAKTRRAYNSPASFLSDTVRAGIAGRNRVEERLRRPGQMDDDVDYNRYQDEQDSDSLAADMLIPRDTGKNKVLARLMEGGDFMRTGSVTMRELEIALDFQDANVRDIDFHEDARARDFLPGQRGEGREHHGSDLNTMASEMAVRIVPSMLITHGVGRATLNITNDTHDGRPAISLTGVGGLIREMYVPTNVIVTLEEALKYDLSNVISNNNYYRFDLQMHYNAAGTTRVKIWVDDRNYIDEFDYPTLADCLSTPQITTDKDAVQSIATDISSILDTLDDNARADRYDNDDRRDNY